MNKRNMAIGLGLLFLIIFLVWRSSSNSSNSTTSQPKGSAQSDPISSFAPAIEDVFRQDHENSTRVAKEFKSDQAAHIKEYLNTMSRIDLRSCPPDFQEAFLKHKYAWGDMHALHLRYEGFSGTLTGFMDGVQVQNDKFEGIKRSIAETWHECEIIALRHGANIARSEK